MAGTILDTIRQEAAAAQTYEEMDVILRTLVDASFGEDALRTESGILDHGVRANATYLRSEDRRFGFVNGDVSHTAHVAPKSLMDRYKAETEEFCRVAEFREQMGYEGILGRLEQKIPAARAEILAARGKETHLVSMEEARQVSAHINAGGEVKRDYNMKALREAYEKMESEHKLPTHKDSPQYTAMKEALRKVCDMQPGDPGMKKAMDELHDAAEAYAEKSAFTSKKTPNGIRRKNTSLLLMSLTDQGKTYHMLYEKNGLVDTRLKTFKKQTDFKSLMAEEMKRNERKYGARAEQRQARRRAEMAKMNPSVRTNDQAMTPSGR